MKKKNEIDETDDLDGLDNFGDEELQKEIREEKWTGAVVFKATVPDYNAIIRGLKARGIYVVFKKRSLEKFLKIVVEDPNANTAAFEFE